MCITSLNTSGVAGAAIHQVAYEHELPPVGWMHFGGAVAAVNLVTKLGQQFE
jgi:hypothetical protein